MEIKTLTPEELERRIKNKENVVVVDVRAEDKFNEYHLDQAINIPKIMIFDMENTETAKEIPLPNNKEIIITCTTGNSAKKCAAILANQDFNVTVLEGGITAWKEYTKSK